MPDLLSIGTVLRSRYQVERVIWETRLMNVYYIHDIHLPANAWVLREMQLIGVDDLEMKRIIKNFEQEALKLSSLSHPQFATVIDFFQEGKNLYIVREYVNGTDLDSLYRKAQKPFAESEIVLWATQIAELFSWLYSKKLPAIFFREFNIKNIIRMPAGGVKLIDLGMARVFQIENDEEILKRMGSTEYAAPEQFSEGGAFDARSLVYSLGAFMYHTLTGVSPSSSPFNLKPVDVLNPVVSKKAQDIIKTATENDPRNRFQSLNEFKQELLHLAKSGRAPEEQQGPGGKNDRLINLVIGVIVALVLGILAYYFYLR